MAHRKQVHGVPSFVGDVVKTKVNPHVATTFDWSLEVVPRKITPLLVPAPPAGEVKRTRVVPTEPTFDQRAEVKTHKGRR
jgi:hypothetical protein